MAEWPEGVKDKLGKLNPTTGEFTMYPLPTRGTKSRHLAVDNSTDIPTVWVPYTGAGKIARGQFRWNEVTCAC